MYISNKRYRRNFTSSFIASAASLFRTASLTSSHPASANSFICLDVLFNISGVGIAHRLNTNWLLLPILTFPIEISFDFLLLS